MYKKKIISISLFILIIISLIMSFAGLVFGLIQESQKTIIIEDLDNKNDYGLKKALINDKKISSLIIKEENKYLFSKKYIDSFSVYIFDQALKHTKLIHKRIVYYDEYKISYELNEQRNQLIYDLVLYYQKIDFSYKFKFLIKIK